MAAAAVDMDQPVIPDRLSHQLPGRTELFILFLLDFGNQLHYLAVIAVRMIFHYNVPLS